MHHRTRPEDKVTLTEKLSYASGAVTFNYSYFFLATLAFPIFNLTLGMNATLIGIVLAVGRLWDAITDPIMGAISDNARTPFGRRRPFIFAGAVLCAVALPLLFFVPESWGETAKFIWFTIAVLFLYLAATVYCVPYLSLGYEITPDPAERTRLQMYRAYAGALINMTLGWMYALAQNKQIFPDTVTGIRIIAICAGIVCIVAMLPVIFNCRDRFVQKASKQRQVGIIEGLVITLKNKPFVIFVCGCVGSMLCAPMLVGSMAVYINSYHVYPGDTEAGALIGAQAGVVYLVFQLISLPFAVKLANKYGKKRVMRWCLTLGMVGALSQFFTYTPVLPQLQFLSVALIAPGLTAFWLLVDPMKADCADYDEWKTGLRREGTYAAVANWIEKLSISLVLVFSGALLDLSGFDKELGAQQPEGTMLTLRLLYALVPGAAYAVALTALHFYELDDQRMAQVRQDLEERRGKINP